MININGTEIGVEYPPYFIADIAANHNGELEKAYKLIEFAKEAGANAAKFQNFTAKKIISDKGFKENIEKVSHQSNWKKSVFETYSDASIPSEWSRKLKNKCDSVGIEYMTSPYDLDNVDLADKYVNAFKIGSGDITWSGILEYIASKKKPVLLATGASNMDEVKKAVDIFKNNELVLMQCNTNYTGDFENFKYINLNVLNTYKKDFPNAVLGLSDHTKGYTTVIGAITLGARVIEKHFTDNSDQEGPDHKFSMEPQEFREMILAGKEIFLSLGDGIKKIEKNEKETSIIQRRALYYCVSKTKGEIVNALDIEALRPAPKEGVPPYKADEILKKKISRDVNMGDLVRENDFKNRI